MPLVVVWRCQPRTTTKMSKSPTNNSANAPTSPNRIVETITPMPAVRLEALYTLYHLGSVTHQKEILTNIAATNGNEVILSSHNGMK